MTRDEAIKTASKHGMAGEIQLVDALVALGVLTLEEPKTAYRQMLEIARAYMDNKAIRINVWNGHVE